MAREYRVYYIPITNPNLIETMKLKTGPKLKSHRFII